MFMRRPLALFALLCCPLTTLGQQGPLTGDWCGNRSYLGECCGITFDLDAVQFFGGVVSGGVEQTGRYAGHNDYVVNFDMDKLAGREGLFVKLRAEHRYGVDYNRDAGAFLPATIQPELPIADSEDVYLTNVLLTQFLSERVAVFAGKLDTFDGDYNAFASGRGKERFSNLGFVANPVTLRTVPYSTLGAGFLILGEDGLPVVSYTLLNAVDTTDSAGFSELFEEGVAMALELRTPTRFFGMPGSQLFGGTWNSRDFISLGQDPRVILPDVPINETDGSWSLYWNGAHYLHVDPCTPGRGWGLFGRAGLADDRTSAFGWFLSFGVGGNNPMRGHEADTFGVGWFVNGLSNEIGPLLQAVTGPLSDGHGVELFYNWQATSWLNVTPDLQVLIPERDNVDTALALGVRAVVAL